MLVVEGYGLLVAVVVDAVLLEQGAHGAHSAQGWQGVQGWQGSQRLLSEAPPT